MSAPLRVCFHAPLLWPLWSDGQVAFAGGAEVQQARLASGLAARGLDVTVVTCDYGQPSPTVVQGVRVLRTYRLGDGWPVARFFHPRLSRSLAALHAAAADVYYVRGASLEAGITFDVARARGAAFVFGAAHDHDASPELPLLGNPRDRWWYRRALRGADAVIAQSALQQVRFRDGWGLASERIRNLVDVPSLAADPGRAGPVTWLATYKAAKRPEWFVALARALPDQRFVMAGIVPVPPESTATYEAIRAAARELPNLEVRGTLDQRQVAALHGESALFVHTSPVEGFPNTVLEAWAHGVPTVTAVDPDGVVERERCGEVVGSEAQLLTAVRAWLADPERRRAAGARARRYVMAAHAPEAVLAQFSALLARVAAQRRAGVSASSTRRPSRS